MPGNVCVVCLQDESKTCSRCHSEYYCSKECQKADWKNHKQICKQVVEAAKQVAVSSEHRRSEIAKRRSFQEMSQKVRPARYTVPPYHEEYKKVYAEKEHYEYLWISWLSNSSTNANDDLDFLGMDMENPADRIKRWGGYVPTEFLIKGPQPGDVMRQRPVVPFGSFDGKSSEPRIHLSMRNTPVLHTVFHSGKNYVFIGFVDMFQLIFGTFKIHPIDPLAPITFTGYDKSPIVVARNRILYEMMLKGVSPITILQVWFSTGWNTKTQEDFQKTCSDLLDKPDIEADQRMKILLHHWMVSKRSVKSTQPLWYKFVREIGLSPLQNLRYEIDRIDYARYLFTGCIFGESGEDYVFGNSTMFSLPKGFENHRREEENFFYGLSMSNFNYKHSLMKTVTDKVTSGLNEVIKLVQEGQLVCKFHTGELSVGKAETLEEIKKLNPVLVDWSNVPDFLTVDDYFAMAKACSGTETMHHAHFLNWIFHVYGASLLDYPNKSSLCKKLQEERQEKYQVVKRDRPFLRQDRYLEYHLNAADKILAVKYRNRFLENFFKDQNVNVDEPVSEEFHPFLKSNTCFHISFSFK